MNWKVLLATEEEFRVLPWLGGRTLREDSRIWRLKGRLPPSPGWFSFKISSREAIFVEESDPNLHILKHVRVGYLVGDRLIPDNASAVKNLELSRFERVHLIEPGLDRFIRVSAGRTNESSSLIFIQQEMPLGPEFEAQEAFLRKEENLTGVSGVTPALDVTFRFEVWVRSETERRRQELIERIRLEEEERRREERRQELANTLGSGVGRREMARQDFETGARAALAVGGAEYLDHRQSYQSNEMVVRFSVDDQQFECVCHSNTLQIIDSGICLTAEYNDGDFTEGTKGDSWLTLESLPGAIRQAREEDKLVVYRHV